MKLFVLFWWNLFSILQLSLQPIVKKALFLPFLRSLLITLSLVKKNCCFRKKSGKSLDFWIQIQYEPWFSNNVTFPLPLPLLLSMLKLPLMAERECSPLIRSSRCYIQMWVLINYIMEFALPGTHILSDMCFSTQETHITSYGIECLSLSNVHLYYTAPKLNKCTRHLSDHL